MLGLLLWDLFSIFLNFKCFLVVAVNVLISFSNLKYIPVVRDSQSQQNKTAKVIFYCLFEDVTAFFAFAKKSLFNFCIELISFYS